MKTSSMNALWQQQGFLQAASLPFRIHITCGMASVWATDHKCHAMYLLCQQVVHIMTGHTCTYAGASGSCRIWSASVTRICVSIGTPMCASRPQNDHTRARLVVLDCLPSTTGLVCRDMLDLEEHLWSQVHDLPPQLPHSRYQQGHLQLGGGHHIAVIHSWNSLPVARGMWSTQPFQCRQQRSGGWHPCIQDFCSDCLF
jgi:hypothetical protein